MHKITASLHILLTCLVLSSASIANAACCNHNKTSTESCSLTAPTVVETVSPCRPAASAPCYVVGGNSEFCESEPEERLAVYEWRLEDQCFREYGICERDAAGQCGWRRTNELLQCIGNLRNEIAESIEPCSSGVIKRHTTPELPPK